MFVAQKAIFMQLELQQISKTYPNGTRALSELSLTISTGMFGLLGPNGAGKSTLMRTIATLQQPDTGSMRFGNIDLLMDPMALRKTLGYLPQEFGVYPRISAERLLDYLARLKGIAAKNERREMVDYCLEVGRGFHHHPKPENHLGAFQHRLPLYRPQLALRRPPDRRLPAGLPAAAPDESPVWF